MPATRGSHGVGSLVVHEGFPPSSHCRGDDELVIVRREKLQHPCALRNGRSMAAASSTGRSMSCRGIVAKEYGAQAHATEVGYLSSSRWPHDRCHMHLCQVPAAASVATCSNCLSTIVCSEVMTEDFASTCETTTIAKGHVCKATRFFFLGGS
ncbi:hypothetical protein L7F22_026445 [Adiantum nelumboides]|nr:hypothetical protein [Adiantum nelumboides]